MFIAIGNIYVCMYVWRWEDQRRKVKKIPMMKEGTSIKKMFYLVEWKFKPFTFSQKTRMSQESHIQYSKWLFTTTYRRSKEILTKRKKRTVHFSSLDYDLIPKVEKW